MNSYCYLILNSRRSAHECTICVYHNLAKLRYKKKLKKGLTVTSLRIYKSSDPPKLAAKIRLAMKIADKLKTVWQSDVLVAKVSGEIESENIREKSYEEAEQKSWGMLVLQVPKFKISLKLARLFGTYSVWAAYLLSTDNTRTTHTSFRMLKGSIPAGNGGENDKFDACAKLRENVLYLFSTN